MCVGTKLWHGFESPHVRNSGHDVHEYWSGGVEVRNNVNLLFDSKLE